ncbi:MAG: NfeD family protein, partial [Synergistaceae bacterium]|jgi:membrane protein implicated in regulation of membrane protease activity|nr:NfeD family protein [Synergistaceae bacterium]
VDFLYGLLTEGWKLWLIAGLAFFTAEGVNPGTFALFFGGLGALVTSLTCFFLPSVAESGTWQLLIFAGMSLCSLLLLRSRIARFTRKEAEPDMFIGRQARALTVLRRNAAETGRVLFEGTEWTAALSSDAPDEIPQGHVVEAVKMEGLTVRVRPVQE